MMALHRAAKARKPGVRYITAFSSSSALFRDSLYTDEGLARHTASQSNGRLCSVCSSGLGEQLADAMIGTRHNLIQWWNEAFLDTHCERVYRGLCPADAYRRRSDI